MDCWHQQSDLSGCLGVAAPRSGSYFSCTTTRGRVRKCALRPAAGVDVSTDKVGHGGRKGCAVFQPGNTVTRNIREKPPSTLSSLGVKLRSEGDAQTARRAISQMLADGLQSYETGSVSHFKSPIPNGLSRSVLEKDSRTFSRNACANLVSLDKRGPHPKSKIWFYSKPQS